MTKQKQKQPPLPTLTEKQEEFFCDRAARMMGFTVVKFSQPRRTMQTRGIPDRLYLHTGRGVAVWAEIKSEKGKLSAHQQQLHAAMRAAGQDVVVGTANFVGAYLAGALKARYASTDAIAYTTGGLHVG